MSEQELTEQPAGTSRGAFLRNATIAGPAWRAWACCRPWPRPTARTSTMAGRPRAATSRSWSRRRSRRRSPSPRTRTSSTPRRGSSTSRTTTRATSGRPAGGDVPLRARDERDRGSRRRSRTFYYPPKMFWEPRRPSTSSSRSRTLSSRPTLWACATSRLRPARDGSADHGHRERPPHARTRRRPGSGHPGRRPDREHHRAQASPRASTRPTTTATSARSGGRSRRPWPRSPRSPTRRPPRPGFDTKTPYDFVPFTPTLPNPSASSSRSRAPSTGPGRRRRSRRPGRATWASRSVRRCRARRRSAPGSSQARAGESSDTRGRSRRRRRSRSARLRARRASC